jgi:hypothetical protein
LTFDKHFYAYKQSHK